MKTTKMIIVMGMLIASAQANANFPSKFEIASEIANKVANLNVQNIQPSKGPTNSGVTRSGGSCMEHSPLGAPKVVLGDVERIERRSFYLCRDGYALQFDPQKKTPLWASEYLSASLLRGGKEERTDDFRPDPAVPYGAQATLNDYRGSKFDRGHVVPAADMNGRDQVAMSETFFLTNMVPQVGPNNNRGIWADLESQVRRWATAKGRLHVVTGPIFNGEYAKMGRSGVAIPTHLYKVIIDTKTYETVAFIIPNVQVKTVKVRKFDEGNPQYAQTLAQSAIDCNSNCSLPNFVVKVADIERVTGIKFFTSLPEAQRNKVVNQETGNFNLTTR